MTHVLHVLQTLDPASGGVAATASRLADGQRRAGHDARVLTAPDARRLAESIAVADCLHLHGVWDTVLYRAARIANRNGTPYVLTPHGMLDPWSLAQKAIKKRVALALGYRRTLDRAATLVALHQDEAASFRALGLRAPIVVIPNAVSLPDPEPDPAAFRATVPGLGDRPYALFLGRLHHKKGLDYLAQAFVLAADAVADAHLVVAGPDEGARERFERAIAAASLAGRVHTVGTLLGPAKWGALAGAACFCLPSRQEGFSVAVLEALACRTPAIVSPECHFPEVESQCAGYVVPLDPPAIAAAMARLLGDALLRDRLGAAGRRLVEARYTWAEVVTRTTALYESVVAPTTNRAGAG